MQNITFLSSKMFGAYDSCSSTLNVLYNKRMIGTCEIASHQSLIVRHRNGTYRQNKRFDEKFSGRRVQRHSTIAFAAHTKCRSALLTHTCGNSRDTVVWGENDAVFLINTFHREREREKNFCKTFESSVHCRLNWLQ